jgi:energy-coupling factor transporter transmembrane protein EcfT
MAKAARGARFRAAAGALAVLFARSYARAEAVHNAMAARGFQGRFRLLTVPHFGWADALFLVAAASLPWFIRVVVEVWA